jgi:fucose permease
MAAEKTMSTDDSAAQRRRVVGLFGVMLVLTAFGMTANAIPPLTTTISHDLNIPYDRFGYVFMLQFVLFTVASFTGGWLSDKYGISLRTLLILGFIIVCLSLLFGSLLNRFIFFIFWIIPLGFAGGLLETFSTILAADYDKPGSGKIVNLSQGFFCIGAIASPQIVSFLLKEEVSWRMMFILFAVFLTGIGVTFVLLYKKPGRDKEPDTDPRSTDASTDALSGSDSPDETGSYDSADESGAAVGASEETEAAPQVSLGESLKLLAKQPLFLFFSLSIFLYVAAEGSIVIWVAPFFEKFLGETASSAAWRIGLYWGGILAGRFLVAILPRRFTLWQPFIIGAAGMLIGSFLLSLHLSPLVATILVAATGFFSGPVWPSIVSLSIQLGSSRQFTSGIVGIGALGVAFGPFISSYIIRFFGIRFLFPAIAVIAFGLFAISIIVRRYTRT